ncbi:MAG TPA: FtsK/SpoIIIE domain-containing protein [Streptosporangiaceae bacterium]|nr:FtsK/SpoIIIE domain-containing protein [Streptosporangiaceae bacterium]
MRLMMTAVSPAAGIRVDVLLDADSQTPAGDIAAELAALLHGSPAISPAPAGLSSAGLGAAGLSAVGNGLAAAEANAPGAAVPANVIRFPAARPDGRDLLPAQPGARTAAGDTTVLALHPDARRQSGPGSHGTAPVLYVDGRPVPAAQPVADSPLRPGCVVSLGDPSGCLPPEPTGIVEIRVASGPGAGAVHRLSVGAAEIGTSAHAAVRLPAAGPAGTPAAGTPAAGLALRITVDARGACQLMAAEGTAAALDGEPVTGPVTWQPGQQLGIGPWVLELARYEAPDAALRPAEDGSGLDFNRPPRLLPPDTQTKFTLPAPPGREERRPLPILMAVVPVLLGVLMAVLMHEVYMLAMCALSPVTMIGSYFSDRKHGRKSYAARMAAHREHRARVESDAHEALAAELAARRDSCPDPATVLTIAAGPRRRLWERRRSDPDFLLLRVGIADLPSAVELRDPAQDEHRQQVVWAMTGAPVAIPLRERGVIGIAGPDAAPRAIGRWLLAQTAVLHSPNDVQVCLLTDSTGQDSWEWARWLPHCQHPGAGSSPGAAMIGNDPETVGARIAELLAIVKDRQKARADARRDQVDFRQADILVIFDGSRRLRSLPGAIQVLREGPAVGVLSVCLDSDERLLPAECQAVAAVQADGMLRVQQMSSTAVSAARPDQVAPGWCLRVARSLAPIRDISDDDEGLGLPESSRLLDVLAIEPPTAAAIAGRWSASGRSTMAVVGESYDGPFGIDVRRDGPHGLIAGTTGAGKSELLQTIVASLAVANRPDAMTFVLVDYKGGSAFKDCVSLPHTVGMVTDLDTHLVSRALESLSAELTRREHILAAVGTKDIEDYTARQARDPGLAPLPRLLIVIDEFASMVRDLPDFVTGLVNIAQRGRSLGIHLILATQRPSGVVSPEIRANTNLRIALRVTDTAESSDVIDAPDAAHIAKSTPGRAYVRLGHSSLVPFQTGRVGGRRPGAASTVTERPWLATTSWADAGRPAPERPAGPAGEAEEITDLSVLVDAIRMATSRMGIPAQHSPWLPALPAQLLLADLPAEAAAPGAPGMLDLVPYGVTDRPSEQAQRTAAIDFAGFGHMMAAGGPRSGRSQLLRTIAGSIGATLSCADVHLYGIDCGNGALLPVADLPHCGAVVLRTQPERAARLIGRLGQELSRRQELLADGGFADIGEQRAAAQAGGTSALPHIVILLDRWEGFTPSLGELDNGRLADVITRILGEGVSAGMHLIMTGDRSLIAGRISSMTDDKLAFRLPDRDDFSFIGLRPREMPDDIPAGRAFRSGSGLETQVALLAPDASGPGQAAALREIAGRAASRDSAVPRAQRPFRVDVLPARLSFDDAWQLRDPAAPAAPLWGLVGVGGDDLAAYGADLADGLPAFIVGGPAKSGRSTVLATMARSFLAAGTRIILVTPRPSPLRGLAAEPGVVRLFEGTDLNAAELRAALEQLDGPGVVIIDDAEVLRDCDAADELREIISFGAERQRALVFGGNSEDLCAGFSGWQVDAKRARRGCLLSPQQITDGDLVGARVARSVLGEPVRPGRALLSTGDGSLITVAVPSG